MAGMGNFLYLFEEVSLLTADSAFSPPLWILYSGRFISVAGDKLYLVALTFLLAKSQASDLTWLWTIGLVAPLLVQFVAGTVADRLGTKLTSVIGDLLCAVATGLMPLFLHSPWLFVLVFLNAAAGTFFSSAFTPMVTHLSSDKNRHQVNSVLSTVNSSATFLGPLLGGWLTVQSANLPFICQALSFVFSACTVALLLLPAVAKAEGTAPKGKIGAVFWSDMRMAFGYLRNNAMLRKIIWITSLLNFGTGAISAYEALFISKAVHIGAGGYGFIVAINGVGMIFAGMANARFAKKWKPITLVPAGVIILLLGFIPYALSINVTMLAISVLIVSAGLITLVTAMRTVRQNAIPVELQGRIMSLQIVLPTVSAGLSVLIGGALLPVLPIRTIIIGAVIMIFICLPIAISMFRLSSSPAMATDIVKAGV